MPVLLFHGDNELEIDEAVRELRAPFQSADVLTFDGLDTPLPTVSEACLTAGLFDPQRLVIVHRLHERLKGARRGAAEVEDISTLLKAIPATSTLLLICKEMPEDHPLVGLVADIGGEMRLFARPKKHELPRWVRQRAKTHDVTIDQGAVDILVDLIGAQPLLLESELAKLATYAGDERLITPPMVESLVGAVTQESIFGLVDAISAGDQAKALRLLHAQLDRASTSPIDFAMYLIRMLARQVRILLRIRLGREAGRTGGEIAADLKLPRYYADRYFRQAARLSTERLSTTFERLAALEYALKSGRGDASSGLDLLVADLCA